MNTDPSKSGMPCGCDPGANHLCEVHKDDRKCEIGHWIRRDNCSYCKILSGLKINKIEIPEGY